MLAKPSPVGAKLLIYDSQNIFVYLPTKLTIMRHLNSVLIFMFLLVAVIPAAFAQKRTVSGKISDASGKGMPFVNVTVKGTNIGTTSNDQGVYSIDVPAGSKTLVYSYTGFGT